MLKAHQIQNNRDRFSKFSENRFCLASGRSNTPQFLSLHFPGIFPWKWRPAMKVFFFFFFLSKDHNFDPKIFRFTSAIVLRGHGSRNIITRYCSADNGRSVLLLFDGNKQNKRVLGVRKGAQVWNYHEKEKEKKL